MPRCAIRRSASDVEATIPACFASCAIGRPAPAVEQRDLGHVLRQRAAAKPRLELRERVLRGRRGR